MADELTAPLLRSTSLSLQLGGSSSRATICRLLKLEHGRPDIQRLIPLATRLRANGKLVGAPSVARTSGFPRLDEAAIKLARVGRYLAGSVDGAPVTECLQLPIRFRIKK